VPLESNGQRRMRTALIAESLVKKGHRVVWWTSTFDHASKSHLFNTDFVHDVTESYRIIFIKTPGYKKHVSLARILDHRCMERKLSESMQKLPVPDLIVSALPVPGLCSAAIRYGKSNNVPIIVDIRDLWPDTYWLHWPVTLRKIAKIVTYRMEKSVRAACREAAALTGITREFLEWGLEKGEREGTALDKVFPLAYPVRELSCEASIGHRLFWRSFGIEKKEGLFVGIFIGVISKKTKLDVLLDAVRILDESHKGKFKIAICGDGEDLERLRRKYGNLPNIAFPGWISAGQIRSLMAIADVGVNLLPPQEDFLGTVNNKAIEYLSAGLPILSSPNRGLLHEMIYENQIGMTFESNDRDALAESLIMMRNDPGMRRRMSENAKQIFRECFTAEAVYPRMVENIETVVGAYLNRAMSRKNNGETKRAESNNALI